MTIETNLLYTGMLSACSTVSLRHPYRLTNLLLDAQLFSKNPDMVAFKEKAEAVKEELKYWEGYVKDGGYVVGDKFTLAGACLTCRVAASFPEATIVIGARGGLTSKAPLSNTRCSAR